MEAQVCHNPRGPISYLWPVERDGKNKGVVAGSAMERYKNTTVGHIQAQNGFLFMLHLTTYCVNVVRSNWVETKADGSPRLGFK